MICTTYSWSLSIAQRLVTTPDQRLHMPEHGDSCTLFTSVNIVLHFFIPFEEFLVTFGVSRTLAPKWDSLTDP